MNRYRVLLMSGKPDGIADALSGCEVVQVKSDLEILMMLNRDSNFDLVLGDIGIPENLANLRRKYPRIPVMILASQPDVSAAFQAAQLGAVDYVPFPLDRETFASRVENAIQQTAAVPPETKASPLTPARQSSPDQSTPRFLSVRELLVDRQRRKAWFREQPVKLTRTEFDILAYLVENKGRAVTFEELVFALTGTYPKYEEARTRLSAHITYLREALSKAGCEGYIVSVRARGYVIEWDVEEKLRQSETRLHFLLQQIPAIIWSTDTDMRLTWAGGAGLADFKLTSDDLIGLGVQILSRNDGDAEPPNVTATRRALQGERVRYEAQQLDTTFEVRIEPLFDAQGAIEGTIGIALNITERKQAEEALRRSERLYHTLVSNLPDSAVYLYDHDLRFLLAGGAAFTGIGLSREMVEGKTLYDIAPPEMLAILEPYYRAAVEGNENIFELPFSDRVYYVHTLPVRNDKGKIFAGLVVSQDITERKRAEEALRENEERYRIISGMMSDYVYASRVLTADDYNTKVEWVAGALTKITGFSEQEVRDGMHWDRLVHPDDWHIVEDRRKRLLNGEQVECEFRMTGKHGKSYWVRTYTYPLWDDQEGRVVRLFAAVKDITQWKEAEAARAAEHNLLHTIIEAAPIQIYAKDMDSRFILANPMVWQLHNLSGKEDIIGKTDLDIFGEAGHADMEAEKQLFATGQPIINKEYFTPAEFGGPRWNLVTKVPLYDADHKIIGLVGVNRDITALKQTMETIRQNEANLREIIEDAPTPVLIYQGTKVVYVNAAIEALTGYSRDEWLSMNFYDVLPAGIQEMAIQQALRRQEGEPVASRRELKIIHKNGDERWINYMATVIQYEGQPAVLAIIADITHQKTVENSLRQQEAALRHLLASTPAPMLIFQDDQVRFANPAAKKLVGYSDDELRAMTIWDVIHPDMRRTMKERWLRRQAGEPMPQRYEVTLVTKDGETHWVDYMGTLIEYEGKPAVLGIVFDITDRKRAEAALREAEEGLRRLIASTPAPMLIFQGERMRFINPAAEKLVGYSQDEMTRMTFWDIIHPDMRSFIRERGMQRQAGEPVPPRYEVKLVTKGSETCWVDYMGTLIEYEGTPAVLGIVFDITDRKRAEAALRESEKEFRAVLDNIPMLVDAFDEQNRIVFWNRECERVTGYSAEEIFNHPDPLSLLYPDPDYLAEHMAEWRRRGDNFRDWEWHLTARDGSIKTVAWSNIAMQFPIPGWKTWGIGVDVTARREAERALPETHDTLRQAIAKAPICLWVINSEGRITVSEGKALAGLGYRPGETVGKSIFDLNRSNPEVLHHIQRALQGELACAWIGPLKGRFFDTRHVPILDDEGLVADVMGIWLDVTSKYPSTGGMR